MTNQSNRWIVKAFKELRKEFGNECQVCGDKENLEFAHVRKTELEGKGRGRKERYYDIKNNKDCYMLLCKACHKSMDRRKK